MREPGWNTRSPGGTRKRNGNHLALTALAALPALVILAAVTGTVLASNPPTLPDNSPTAVHAKAPDPDPQPVPSDPRELFLDLPDPPKLPKPTAPEVPDRIPDTQISDDQVSTVKVSEGAASNVRSLEARAADSPDRRAGGPAAGRKAGAVPNTVDVTGDQKRPPKIRTVAPGSGKAEDLLDDPDCRFSSVARADLRAGIVDEHLVSALQAVCRKHSIYVNVFKTGHTFGAGLPEGPTIPVGYGNAGGYPNTHYFGRAADIWEVDGKPVEGNGADPDVVSVGRILAGLPEKNSPDVVIGPDAWNRALGYGAEQGWILAGDQVALHDDHLHIGYWHGDGTPPPRLFLPTNHQHETHPHSDGGAVWRSESETNRSSSQTPRPKLKERIEPAVSRPPRPAREVVEKKDREKPTSQKTVVRRIQRNVSQYLQDQQAPDPMRPDPESRRPEKTEPKAPQEPRNHKTSPDKQTGREAPPPAPEKREPERPPPEPGPGHTSPQKPGGTLPEEEQTIDSEEAPVQDELVAEDPVIEETPYGGGTVDEDAGTTG